ncbi:MAG: cation:proton antiporter family protein [Pseudomonadota bacterium]
MLWLVFAYACGLGVRLAGLPPLIGFLIAGFALNLAGVQPNETLQGLADLGITLMLFVIGLKLNVRDLLKREVWAGAFSHLGLWMIIACGLAAMAGAAGLGFVASLELHTIALLVFGLGFSSTVCVIKVLEDSGEVKTRHGQLAIGILIMQDIIAVVFLALATGKVPSPWAVLLVTVLALRLVLHFLLGRAGHGEMLPLTGFMLALGGYELFAQLDIKGDIGALIFGVLLSDHVKSVELAKSLLHFKDLFLIGFFLSIGLTALPTPEMIGIAVLLCALLPIKMLLFFALLTRLRLRARTAYLASLVLAGYSEFGLIVIALCVSNAWLSPEWLVITALAVALSFVLTSVAYRPAHRIYARYKAAIRRYENPRRLPEDQVYRPREAEILVIGTGRVGRGAFNALHRMAGNRVWGMDANRDVIERQRAEGMHVFVGDAENADMWELIDVNSIRLVLLAVPSVDDNRNIANQLRRAGYSGPIAAIARFDDEGDALRAAGVDKVFNFFTEAGAGFAEDSLSLIDGDVGEPSAAPAS